MPSIDVGRNANRLTDELARMPKRVWQTLDWDGSRQIRSARASLVFYWKSNLFECFRGPVHSALRPQNGSAHKLCFAIPYQTLDLPDARGSIRSEKLGHQSQTIAKRDLHGEHL